MILPSSLSRRISQGVNCAGKAVIAGNAELCVAWRGESRRPWPWLPASRVMSRRPCYSTIPTMDQVFTLTSFYSLLGVSVIATAATHASVCLLPKNASKTDRWTFIWLVSWRNNWTWVHADNLYTRSTRSLMVSSTSHTKAPGSISLPLAVRWTPVLVLWLQCVQVFPLLVTLSWRLCRERIQRRRFPLGSRRSHRCLPRITHCPRCWSPLSLHRVPDHERRRCEALLDYCHQHGRGVWRLDDILSRLVNWEPELKYFKLATPVGLPLRTFINSFTVIPNEWFKFPHFQFMNVMWVWCFYP